MEELAARVFAARDAAHRAHWKTSSFSEHVALGEFYDQVIDALDEIVECYQGQFGRIGLFTVEVPAIDDITAWLGDEMKWIQQSRDVVANGSRQIENLIDALTAVYSRTIYKLVNLS